MSATKTLEQVVCEIAMDMMVRNPGIRRKELLDKLVMAFPQTGMDFHETGSFLTNRGMIRPYYACRRTLDNGLPCGGELHFAKKHTERLIAVVTDRGIEGDYFPSDYGHDSYSAIHVECGLCHAEDHDTGWEVRERDGEAVRLVSVSVDPFAHLDHHPFREYRNKMYFHLYDEAREILWR